MGCLNSKEKARKGFKPSWKSEEPITREKLQQLRDEFWDTAPHYGGESVIWDALKVAVSADDIESAKLILDAADVIISEPDLSVCYDQKGRKYELPVFVLSDPINLSD
ncbi:ubiquitin domain-containing protein [Chloropicon primus]|uniref:Ubiquitin domain-containing protein n=1 Tax=Chloropicon primus TaxID=1764295 RepID=A0A5B8MK36_9CHLO|nr:ubiquitin domain-containing protein [Chloropicon primus]UPQ99277.1 ubiquitin domain-containing protein [Chloropicon primus]|eukprot:QDZ20065.1 ubiquitin domain-containing protein [Chloropicon primus]